MAGDIRIELMITESKSAVIPLHQSPTEPYRNILMNQSDAALRLADRFQSVSRFSR